MAIFVRGSGIEKATAYELLKKVDDGYEKVWQKKFGKQTTEEIGGYINANGASTTSEYAKHSEMIDVTDFDEADTSTVAFSITSITGISAALAVAFYTKLNDYTSFVYGYTFAELAELWTSQFTGANLVALAEQHNANYVIFSTDVTGDLWYYTPNKINFRLEAFDELVPDAFPAGETHYLVVKAIGEGGEDLDGDGIIYSDSDYGGDADGNPLEYVVNKVIRDSGTLPIGVDGMSTIGGSAGTVVHNNTKRISTASNTNANGILVKAGETITITGLAPASAPALRFDAIWASSAGPQPEYLGATANWSAVLKCEGNYDANNYFPLNADGNNEYSLTNTLGRDAYIFFAFAGPTRTEDLTPSDYTVTYVIG